MCIGSLRRVGRILPLRQMRLAFGLICRLGLARRPPRLYTVTASCGLAFVGGSKIMKRRTKLAGSGLYPIVAAVTLTLACGLSSPALSTATSPAPEVPPAPSPQASLGNSTSDLARAPVPIDLPFVQLADSDLVEIGDDLRILGYPGIGGDTITFTEGAVSGFTSERGVEGRAWIKTDATIAGGNSGGMGVNADGLLMGVPTRASAGGDNAIVDCRAVADTNRDGVIDDQDSCVPIGGFINGLRP